MREGRSSYFSALRLIGASVLMVILFLVTVAPTASANGGYPYAGQPTCATGNCTPDPWRFFYRECTSFVAWKLNTANGLKFQNDYNGNGTLDFGNATNWKNAASTFGFTVDRTPKKGAVAWWSFGHVAWVNSVNSDGTVTVEEYNYNRDGNYSTRRIPAGSPTNYLHFKDLSTTTSKIANGDYIKITGGDATVYRIAGGAPLAVYSWSGVGGSKPVKMISRTQFNALPKSPADGTVIRGVATGKVYIVAGGSPMYVSSWNSVGGSKPYTNVDQRAIDTMPRQPRNGTVMHGVTTETVYVVAGGAPMPVYHWNNIGGSRPSTGVSQSAIDALPDYPANGTVIRGATTSRVYIVAGGAPMHVASWNNIGGTKPLVNLDQRAIDSNLRGYPSDGTFVRGYKSQRIYKIVGQKTIYVSSPSQVTGTPVNIDDWAITNQLKP